MSNARSGIGSKSLWTIGTYVVSAGIRFASNIVLSRLLGPEILGIVVIAQAVRVGTDLLSDVGLEQNVIHSPAGEDTDFLNTAWTIQVIRGILISLVCLALSPLLAGFYGVDTRVLFAISLAPFISAMMSTGIYTLAKRLDVRTRNLYDLASEAVGLVITVILAFTLRNVWAPIFGILLAIAFRSALSYWLPHPRHRLTLSKAHAWDIFHFSKWIMISSLAFYAAVYIDRLYLGRVVTLATLGIYGLAKAISDLPATVAGRLAFQIVFPFVADKRDGTSGAFAEPARKELGRTRLHFLLLVAGGIATVMAWSDVAVHMLYGQRYLDAGWMLCLLLIGSWIAVVAQLNEAIVFGCGQPKVVSFANTIRIAVIAALLPLGFAIGGLAGAILALPATELCRYAILLAAQRRARITYVRQDLALTLVLALVVAGWVGIRMAIGLGVPWSMIH